MRSKMWVPGRRSVLAAVLVFAGGCAQTKMTAPDRSAVEQLLISTAADRALQQADLSAFRDKRVWVNDRYYSSYDSPYVLGMLRDLLSRNGALLVKSEDEAEIIVEPRSGGLSVDGSESMIGLPSTTVPVPLAGNLQTPELYLWKTELQYSTAKIAILAIENPSRRHYYSTGPLEGNAFHKYYRILGYIRYTGTSIPEKQGLRRQ